MRVKDLLMPYLRRYRLQLTLIFISVFCYVALTLMSPLVLKLMVDYALLSKPTSGWMTTIVNWLGGTNWLKSNLWFGFVAVVVTNLGIGFFAFHRHQNSAKVAEQLAQDLRDRLFSHLQYQPFGFFQSNKSGDLIQKCTSDVETIRKFFNNQLSEMVYCVLIALSAVAVLWSLNPKLSMIASVSLPFLSILAWWFFTNIQKSFLISDEKEGELLNIVSENLQGIRVVKAFNKERFEFDRFDQVNKQYTKVTFRLIQLLGYYWSLSDMLCLFQILLVIVVSMYMSQNGQLSVGDFFVFVSYEALILWPMRSLGRVVADMGRVKVAAQRLCEILSAQPEALHEGQIVSLQGDIVFDGVSFRFPDGEVDALHDIDLTIPSGKTTALMGGVGSGKSTLVQLLTRLYDVTSGKITIKNVDISTISKAHLRKMIGLVLQEPFLFSKTIEENIRIARPSADRQQIERAARLADVDRVIKEFDEGYSTMVGEKGVTLSGGQKQRIAMARVIINEVEILIFDDSLSAVDSKTDANIRQALLELSKGMTTILITQRIETAMQADLVVVMEHGTIVQQGTHAQLSQQPGFYQRVAAIQGGQV